MAIHPDFQPSPHANVNELEPAEDPADEDPWSDLWFYSNPIFVQLDGSP